VYTRTLCATLLVGSLAWSPAAQAVSKCGGCPAEHAKDPIMLGSNQWLRSDVDYRDDRLGLGTFEIRRNFKHASSTDLARRSPFVAPWGLNVFAYLRPMVLGARTYEYISVDDYETTFYPSDLCLGDTFEALPLGGDGCVYSCAERDDGSYCAASGLPHTLSVVGGDPDNGFVLKNDHEHVEIHFHPVTYDVLYPDGAARIRSICFYPESSQDNCLDFTYEDNYGRWPADSPLNPNVRRRARRLVQIDDRLLGHTYSFHWSQADLVAQDAPALPACPGDDIVQDVDEGADVGRLQRIERDDVLLISYCYERWNSDGGDYATTAFLKRATDPDGTWVGYANDNPGTLNPLLITHITRGDGEGHAYEDTRVAFGPRTTKEDGGMYRRTIYERNSYQRGLLSAPQTWQTDVALGQIVTNPVHIYTQEAFDVSPQRLEAVLESSLEEELEADDIAEDSKTFPSLVSFVYPKSVRHPRSGLVMGAGFEQGLQEDSTEPLGLRLFGPGGVPWVMVGAHGSVQVIVWDTERRVPVRQYWGSVVPPERLPRRDDNEINAMGMREFFNDLQTRFEALMVVGFDALTPEDNEDPALFSAAAEAFLLDYLESDLGVAEFPHSMELGYMDDPERRELAWVQTDSTLSPEGSQLVTFDYDVDGAPVVGCAPPDVNLAPTDFVHRIVVQGWTLAADSEEPVCRSRVTRFDRDAQGRVTGVDGARTDVDDVVTMSYEHDGRLDRLDLGDLGALTVAGYTAHGQATGITFPHGTSLTFGYTAAGRLESVTESAPGEPDRVTTVTYQAGLPHEITLPDEGVVGVEHDDWGRVSAVVDPTGRRYEYGAANAFGKPSWFRILDAAGVEVFREGYAYGPLARLKSTTDVVDGQWSRRLTRFDAAGGPVKTRLEAEDGTQRNDALYELDPLQRLLQHQANVAPGNEEPQLLTSQFGYDQLDFPARYTDPDGRSSTYLYDDFGNLVRVTGPDMSPVRLEYDRAGNLLRRAQLGQPTLAYTWDEHDRLTAVSADDETVVEVTWDEADPAVAEALDHPYTIGRVARIDTPGGSYSFGYASSGSITFQRVVYEVDGQDPLICVTRVLYDDNQRPTRRTGCLGTELHYTLDDGEVSAVDYRLPGGEVTSVVRGVEHMPLSGAAARRVYADGTEEEWTWDGGLRPLSLRRWRGEQTLDEVSYSYHVARGQLASIERDGQTQATYSYDGLGRLVEVSDTDEHDGTVTFDGAGNATAVSVGDADLALVYEPDTNRLASVGGDPVAHSSRGEVTRLGARRLEYDALGNLTVARDANGALLARYRYDGYGRRVSKLTGGTATFYLYDASDRLAEVVTRDADGTVESRSLVYDGPGFTPVAFVDYRPGRVVERGAIAGAKTVWQVLAALFLALLGWVVVRLSVRLNRLASASLAAVLLLASTSVITSCGMFEEGGFFSDEPEPKPARTPPGDDAGPGDDGGILPGRDGGIRDRDGGILPGRDGGIRPGRDGGIRPGRDGGIRPRRDAGQPDPDVGRPERDAGQPDPDTGQPEQDTGVDAGEPVVDAGDPPEDTGVDSGVDAGEGVDPDAVHAVYLVHADHRGAPVRVVDTDGRVVWHASYSPLGHATVDVAEIDNPVRLPGQVHDAETGLHYNRYRYYDPQTGRYLSNDPVLPQSYGMAYWTTRWLRHMPGASLDLATLTVLSALDRPAVTNKDTVPAAAPPSTRWPRATRAPAWCGRWPSTCGSSTPTCTPAATPSTGSIRWGCTA